MGIYLESIRFEDEMIDGDYGSQQDHAEFAEVLLNNLKSQGFLK